MRKAEEPCFSNGTEWECWYERNCEMCRKAIKGDSKYRCAIQREIDMEAVGEIEYVSMRTYNATQQTDCPFRRDKHQQQQL